MFHFTIRDVLWLTVVVALGITWRFDGHVRSRQAAEADEHILILRADNWTLESRNSEQRAKILRLESEGLPPQTP
jgi:hypothetical protein